MEMTRQIVLDARPDEVWEALTEATERAEWLDDDRPIDILTAQAGETLSWRWSTPDVHGVVSTVELHLECTDDDRTILTVTERPVAAPSCSLAAATVDVEAWDRRLLGLELRCVLRASALATV